MLHFTSLRKFLKQQHVSRYRYSVVSRMTGESWVDSLSGTRATRLLQLSLSGSYFKKTTRCTNFSIFWNKPLHVSDSSSVHNQEFFTVHRAMVYVIQVCWQLASTIRTELEKLSETCRVLFQKLIWEINAYSWFYYKNLSRCTVTWM